MVVPYTFSVYLLHYLKQAYLVLFYFYLHFFKETESVFKETDQPSLHVFCMCRRRHPFVSKDNEGLCAMV